MKKLDLWVGTFVFFWCLIEIIELKEIHKTICRVRNRREAELLLKVSRSAVSLDQLTNNYEMISLRIQV